MASAGHSRRSVLAVASLGSCMATVAPALGRTMSSHVVLLGDSIFDNAAYVPRGEEVITKLRRRLTVGQSATLAAVDGSVIADVIRQFADIPGSATHLIISAGGNDALHASGVMTEDASSVAE